MTSTFHGIETSKRALFVNTVSMQTLGHNIANANTEGYTRQRVNLREANPIWAMGMTKSQQPGQLGTGVEYTSITRIRDSFLDTQFRRENQLLGSWEIQNASMTAIQNILNEPSGSGLSAVMDDFWNSWETLNRDPSLLSARVAVAGAASNMVDTLKHISEALTNLTNDLNNNIDKKVMEANNIVENIARLNVLIRDNESFGDNANDYRDQRDLLLDKLSTIVDVQYVEDENGMVSIISAGANVLEGENVTPLTAANAATATAGQLHGYTRSLQETDLIRNQLNGLVGTMVTGEVKVTLSNGYITTNNMVALNDVTVDGLGVIPAGQSIPAGSKITSSMDVMVKGFNGLHQLGYTLTEPTTSGIPFFTSASGNFTIDSIQVNPEILADTNKIAASSQYETVNGVNKVIRGNSDVANALASMRDAIFTFPDALTSMSQGSTDDYFRALTADLGIRASNTERNHQNEQTMTDNLQMQRQSVSGVSMDEELADMIRFQQAYNAAARNMTTVDEMLDRVINQMGRVGL
ncbi:flagellar hook-associated protein FlgK [Paenibacillus sp. alder61]|uniref:Flagellar hook-associated protein 1 n=1 Tax=Paenibacillus faecis TaxID=862114 RepID=A0A5D0CQ55_9BACL|nr:MULTISPECIES: flagellar hook-associated protein FlgK [Paenibacillus]MCA1293996.1 flagellar hook-associated protein FlgK [Paenibacillus sp. alder61]TYA11878.1 flagellar hook-associated protein FlgK [Paenibacillus faecis]